MKDKTTLVEFTSKHFKLHKLVSKTFIILGIIMILSNISNPERSGLVIGCLCALFGLVFLSITRIRIWWNHK